MKTKKINYKIIIRVVLAIILFYLLITKVLFYLISNTPLRSKNFDIEILNSTSKECILTLQQTKHNTYDFLCGNTKIVHLTHDSITDKLHYKQKENLLYIWMNGNYYESYNDQTLNREIQVRNKTDVRLFKIDLQTSSIKELKIKNRKKSIILDVILFGGKEFIVLEQTNQTNLYHDWKNSYLKINDHEFYPISVTNLYAFESNILQIGDRIIIPTYQDYKIISLKNFNVQNQNYSIETKDWILEKVEITKKEKNIICLLTLKNDDQVKYQEEIYDTNFHLLSTNIKKLIYQK